MKTIVISPDSLHKDFESIKKINTLGFEYWDARELMSILGYKKWQDFLKTIKKAQISCITTAQSVPDHFMDAHKMVEIGSKTQRKVKDFQLSRLACYLIAQNGDSRKAQIAFAQTYFAVQTRKQEIFQQLDADGKRIYVRQEVTTFNKKLFDTAQKAGVKDFGKFNNAGYLGLYGLTAEQIQSRKKLGKDDILDRAGSVELAANLFRITQTDEKLLRDQVRGEDPASHTHHEVGKTVRETIKKLGGVMPEKLSPEEHIKKVIQKKIGKIAVKKGVKSISKK